jgi:hypothetical protein
MGRSTEWRTASATISGSSDVEVAAHHLIHHLPHGCGTLRAEAALEFSHDPNRVFPLRRA